MSKRTILIFLTCCLALAVGGIGLLTREKEQKETYYGTLSPDQVARAKAVLEHDTDNDGLKDWEEELWQTDPKNPDSDGDGTPDGEEIRLERNPLAANKAEKGSPATDPLDKETIDRKTMLGKNEWTATDRLSREFFGKYLTLKKSGTPLTPEEEQKLIDDVVNNTTPTEAKKVFSSGDVARAARDDENAYWGYGNAIGAVLLKRQADTSENELVIFERALDNDDEADLASLQTRVTRYEALISDIKAIPAPSAAVDIHRDLLNALELLKESVEGMTLAMTDPVSSLGPISAYPQGITALTGAFDQLSKVLKENGASYGKNDAGVVLTE
ncbi:MAG: hypothetical protein Q7R93_04045 [bacterium]|nr:hypothetical protein [bacterium]